LVTDSQFLSNFYDVGDSDAVAVDDPHPVVHEHLRAEMFSAPGKD
jgi:hypothetical protein